MRRKGLAVIVALVQSLALWYGLAPANAQDDCTTNRTELNASQSPDKPPVRTCGAATASEGVQGVDTLVSPLTTTSLSAALSTNQRNTEFRATFLPAQFIDRKYSFLLSELRFVLLADTSSSVTRIAVSTGYNPFAIGSDRGGDIIRRAVAHAACSNAGLGDALTWCNNRRKTEQWKEINSGFRPAVLFTGSYDLYPYGKSPDPNNPTQQVALEWNGGGAGQLSFEFRPQQHWRAQLWGSAKYIRPDGNAGSELSRVLGGGFTLSWIAWDFLPEKPVKSTDYPEDYIREGFIPGVALGTSIQIMQCNGEEECAKQRTSQWSATPYVDILVSTKLQLRISVPITRFKAVDAEDGTDIAGTLNIAGSLGTP
jgi:hypothetical protein